MNTIKIKSANNKKYTVRIMFNGDLQLTGKPNNIFIDDDKFGPIIQFFCEHPTDKTKFGTMISSYYITTLLENRRWIDNGDDLGLCGYYPELVILNPDLIKILNWCLANERVAEELSKLPKKIDIDTFLSKAAS
ncbi:hypothetical protein [Sulfurospirillum sp. MES]|uniref:hypothetical protein n=1 Tax=Sulfurospirillum sp. MES TaxID=1565314 RepID=UPI0005420BB1|nr:hypothetical protein [Sulfurospirillum sp. MES]KHG32968.1 MAG: hypothetical protein OA34_12275 [Sulfurospirillum sp. MES]